MTRTTEQKPHKHKWNVFVSDKLIEKDGVLISKSPCSHADDIIGTVVQQQQGCECGEKMWRNVAIKNERFRGDDERRARGLEPLGNLPGSYG